MKSRFSRLVLSGMLATGLALCSAAAFSQDNQNPGPDAAQGPGGGPGGRRGQMTPEENLDRMTKRYNLTSDQQAKLKPILESQQQQMMAIRQDSSMSREDRMAKMQSLRTESTAKIEAVLNDQQKQQFEADQQRMGQRRGGAEGGGGEGGGQAGPPQS